MKREAGEVFFYDKDLSTMGFGGTVGWLVGLLFGSLLLGGWSSRLVLIYGRLLCGMGHSTFSLQAIESIR